MSTDRQDTSIAAQRAAVAVLAKSYGYKIIREYVDSGISGDATEKRIEFQRMLATASSGDFRAVLCWDQDRFGRFDPLEAGYWIKPLRDNGIQLVTVGQGVINWNDIAGRLLYTVQQEGKHQFLRDLSRNSLRGMLAKAQQGYWLCGDPPYGFRVGADGKLTPDSVQSAIVREIYRQYLAGRAIRGIAADLNARNVPGPRGGVWHGTTIYRTLRNPANVGQLRYNATTESKYSAVEAGVIVPKNNTKTGANHQSEWVVVEDAHSAIVDRKTFDQVAQQFGERLKFPGPNTSRIYLFKGLLACGYCGHAMHGAWVKRPLGIAYSCSYNLGTSKCNPNRTRQQDLLDAIRDTLKDQFLSRKAIAAAKAAVIASLSEDTGPSPEQARRTLEAAKAKLRKAESRLVEVDRDLIQTVSEQIRSLRLSAEQAEAAVRTAAVPRRAIRDEKLAALESSIEAYRQIMSAESSEVTESLVALFRACFDRIIVTSVKDAPAHRAPTGRYRLVKVELIPKNAGKPLL